MLRQRRFHHKCHQFIEMIENPLAVNGLASGSIGGQSRELKVENSWWGLDKKVLMSDGIGLFGSMKAGSPSKTHLCLLRLLVLSVCYPCDFSAFLCVFFSFHTPKKRRKNRCINQLPHSLQKILLCICDSYTDTPETSVVLALKGLGVVCHQWGW